MKKVVISVLLSMYTVFIYASEPADSLIEMYSCKGTDIQCDSNFVNISDQFTYDTTSLTSNSLGIIKDDIIETIKFPQENAEVIYTFTPTQSGPPAQGKEVKLLIVSFNVDMPIDENTFNGLDEKALNVIKENIRRAKEGIGKWIAFMYKMYRKLENDHAWTEIATIFSQEPITDQLVKIKPNGDIIFAKKQAKEQETLTQETPDAIRILPAAKY